MYVLLDSMSNTEQEIKSILQGMQQNIDSGKVTEFDGMSDAMDLIKQEVGLDDEH